MIVAIETTGQVCSVALFRTTEDRRATSPNRTVVELTSRIPRSHDRVIARLFSEALAVAGIAPDELEGIAVSVGPGSYTGIRIGISFAIGLGTGLEAPLVAVPTLDAIAWGARQFGELSRRHRVLATVPDGRGELFAGLYTLDDGCTRLTQPKNVGRDDVLKMVDENVIVAGPGASLLESAPTAVAMTLADLDAGIIAAKGFELWRRGICTTPEKIRAQYLAPFASGDGRVARS